MAMREAESLKNDNSARRDEFKNSMLAQTAEFFFVLLPILVILLLIATGAPHRGTILQSPEWSFGAAVLFGQTIVKIVAAVGRARAHPWEKPAFLVAALIVFGLVPSMVILARVSSVEDPAPVLQFLQLTLFLVGGLAFVVFGSGSHYLMFRGRPQPQQRSGLME